MRSLRSTVPSARTAGHGSPGWAAHDDERAAIRQEVSIDAQNPSCVIGGGSSRSTTCGWDYARVLVDGTEVASYTLCAATNTDGWDEQQVDLSALRRVSGLTLEVLAETGADFTAEQPRMWMTASLIAGPTERAYLPLLLVQ